MAPSAFLSSRESVPLHFDPFEISTPHIIYACMGGFIVLFGMFSLILREKLYIGEACWAFLFGVIIGPYGANIFNPREWGASNHAEASEDVTNQITLEFTRVVLSIGVFAIGVELPKQYMKIHWRSIAFMLAPIMTWGWFVSAGFIYLFVPGLNFLSALTVAACLTPTDPILAAAVVGGKFAEKHVPSHIRHLLAAESGCNDGAAFPFLFIALYLILDSPDTGAAIRDWFVLLWIYQILLGVTIGAIFGIAFRYLMKFCERKRLIDRHSYVAQYLSLALLTTGVTVLLGSDDLLSTFSCGTAFAWDGFFNRQTEEAVFSSVIDLLFNIAAFVYVGAWMPFSQFQNEELTLVVWKLVLLAICILLFKRLPIVLMLYKWIPDIKTFREALFVGHFGPIGIGGVFISTLANEFIATSRHPEGEEKEAQIQLLEHTIQPITAFLILFSVTIHGLSIPSFSLGKRVRSISMSRTWTRERSITIDGRRVGRDEPEWVHQVTMGGVVQKDGTIKGGETDIEKLEDNVSGRLLTIPEIGRSTPSSGPSSTQKESDLTTPIIEESREDVLSGTNESHTKRPATLVEEDWRRQNPPDGEDVLQIWDEGPHRIIERRKGPGEEVYVEVIRYHNVENRANERSHLVSRAESVKHSVGAYLKHLEEEAMSALHLVSRRSTSRPRSPSSLSNVNHLPSETSKERQEEVNVEEEVDNDFVIETESERDAEEGWEEEPHALPGRSRSPAKNRKRAPRLGTTPIRTKRRGSQSSGTGGFVRRSIVGPARSGSGRRPSITVSSPQASESEEGRGRMVHKKIQSRVDNLKVESTIRSRDASPARSIRFMDEPRVQPAPRVNLD